LYDTTLLTFELTRGELGGYAVNITDIAESKKLFPLDLELEDEKVNCYSGTIRAVMEEIFLKFDWDPEKNKSNQRKHGIDFREAKTVFQDARAIEIYDEEHSMNDDDRYIIIGISRKDRELMVCHCYRNDGDVVRIFSARKATATEKELYERGF